MAILPNWEITIKYYKRNTPEENFMCIGEEIPAKICVPLHANQSEYVSDFLLKLKNMLSNGNVIKSYEVFKNAPNPYLECVFDNGTQFEFKGVYTARPIFHSAV